MWPQSLLWQFLCFLTRSFSMSLFPATLMALLQNLSFQTVCFPKTVASLFLHCHLVYIGLNLVLRYSSSRIAWIQKKKSEETFFNYVFQKIFRLIQKICTNNTRNLLHFSTGFKIRELLVISHYYLIYRLFFQISSVFLLSISDSRSNPGSFIKWGISKFTKSP